MAKAAVPGTWRARFLARRHTILLIAIIVAFAARPLIGDFGLAPIVFSIAILAVLMIALLTMQVDDMVGDHEHLVAQRKRRTLIGWALAVPAVVERLLMLVSPSPTLLFIGSACWAVFFAFVTVSQLRSVLKQRAVTGETIANAVSVYLLIGLTWGIVYVVLYQLDPQAFNFGSATPPTMQDVFPTLIYFSMTTLSTIGFGDITPMTLQARYLAVSEGITGQLYLAILVARLVGMQMSTPQPHHRGD
jgi:amino acid transporter